MIEKINGKISFKKKYQEDVVHDLETSNKCERCSLLNIQTQSVWSRKLTESIELIQVQPWKFKNQN